MPSRRRVLALAATGTALTAGCLSPTTSEPDAATPSNDRTDATTASADDEPTTGGDPATGPVRGGAAQASAEREVVDEDYEYVEGNDTVRYPATMSGDSVVDYGYEPFEEWAHVEGASVAADRVHSLLAERLSSTSSLSVAVGRRDDGDGLRLAVSLTTHLDRDGDVISEPSVSRAAAVRATPHTVSATVHFAGRTHTDTYPVYVRRMTIQNQ